MRLARERTGALQALVVDNAAVPIRIEGSFKPTLCGFRSGGLGFFRFWCVGVVGIKVFTFALLALCLSGRAINRLTEN